MPLQRLAVYLTVAVILLIILDDQVFAMSSSEKQALKLKVVEMFKHAYGAYMDHAYPADELMPLSCKGRYRGSEPSRGDVDDSLGNFTLTLVDTLDTLAIMGDLPEFERAVRKVIKDTKFDADVAVSVFETNIRLLGGLLGGHVIATYLKRRKFAMEWYADELLSMAKELGNRLLPAFNTTTGIPFPRVNLKQGISADLNQKNRDTCTACAGTMILEFAALSRLTGDPVYEEKAHKAMDYLWKQRHRSSDLMGTVINIQNGDWIRRESGVGAGIDSYYEYVLKAYILLGDDTYLERFNKHYDAIMKYVSQGPLFVDVHMHRPHTTSRHFMDALLAFWPGLQVLKGDIQPAIELHEMLYQVMQRHNFLPEAFTSDFRVHWGQHPLRPEFVESTYFLYKATGDPHYLEVGRVVIENLEAHARVPCGFAALKDVTRGTHEDQMDSFVLAETFKYLFLLYADKSDMVLDVDDYIFTTEAHLLPLSLSLCNTTRQPPQRLNREMYSNLKDLDDQFSEKLEDGDHNTCPNPLYKYKQSLNYAQNLRLSLKDYVKSTYPENAGSELPLCPSQPGTSRLRAQDFVAGNKQQLLQLKNMGIQLVTMNDGRIQLLHTATEALTPGLAEDGLRFMQEMIELSKTQQQTAQHDPMLIQLLSPPYLGSVVYKAGPAQFGYDLKQKPAITGLLHVLEPFKGCTEITNPDRISGKIAILERGDCMFVDKARNIERAGAIGGIVIDHNPGTASDTQPLFAMSGDNNDDVHIPMLFLFHKEGQALIDAWEDHTGLQVMMTDKIMIFGSEADSSAGKSTNSQSETEEGSGCSESSQSGHTSESEEKTKETEERFKEPYIERMFEFQPLQPVGEGNQFNMKTGTQKVKMHVNIHTAQAKPYPPTATDNGIINLKTLSDGSKQLVFDLENVKMETGALPGIEEIYLQVLDTLQTKTNFEQLKYKTRYISSLLALLEAAYYGVKYENEHVRTLFNEMANQLEIKSGEPEDEGIEQDETPIQELGQLKAEEAELKRSSDQSESILHSGEEVQYSHEEAPRVQIIEQGGMRVRITSRSFKEGSASYADEKDFEEGVNKFLKEIDENVKEISEKLDLKNLELPGKDRADLVGVFREKESDLVSESEGSIGTEKTVSEESIGDSVIDSDSDLGILSTMSKNDVTEMPVDEMRDSNQQESDQEESSSQEERTDHTQRNERKLTNRRHGDL